MAPFRITSHKDRSGTFRVAFSEHYDECVLLHLRLDPPHVKAFVFSCRSCCKNAADVCRRTHFGRIRMSFLRDETLG